MSETTITLSERVADQLERLTRDRAFASQEQTIAAALSALEADEPDPVIDAWLRDIVAPRFDASLTDPGRALTPNEVRDRLGLPPKR